MTKYAYRLTDAEANVVWLALLNFNPERAEELSEAQFDALVELFGNMDGGETPEAE